MLNRLGLLVVALGSALTLAGCGSTTPSSPVAPAPAASPPSSTAAPAPASTAAAGSQGTGGPRLAPRDPALEHWKRQAAERIHTANSQQLFEGRPHHLLQGVIVVDVTVDRNGQVTRSKIVRSPGIARLDSMVLASLKSASPLPPPPPALVKTGGMTFSETWLFTNDSKWRLRTLTLPQE